MIRSYNRCLTFLVVLAVAAPAWAQFGRPAKVVVANVELRELPSSSTLVGTVEPVTRSTVGSEIAGLVQQMPVRQGDFVGAGDLLCKLKDDTTRLRLAEAGEWLKSLEAAQRKWVFELERVQHLYGAQDASDKEVYNTHAEHGQARYAVTRQKVVVAGLKTQLGKTEIRAPFSGFVVTRHTEVGQWLPLGGDVVEIVDLSRVLVTVDVPEGALPYVQVGAPASAAIDALGRSFDGQVRHVLLQADPTARTFPVEIEVPNPGYVEVDGQMVPAALAPTDAIGDAHTEGDDRAGAANNGAENPSERRAFLLAGGMFARVTVQTGPAGMTPAVPKDAVVRRGGVDTICAVMPGQEEGSLMAMPMSVTTGMDIGNWIAITSGNLQPGMQVVTRGNENILFPSPIQIVESIERPERTAAAPHTTPAGTETGS